MGQNSLGQTKLTNSLGKQQRELSTHTWPGRAPLYNKTLNDCFPLTVNIPLRRNNKIMICTYSMCLGEHWGSRGNKNHSFLRGQTLICCCFKVHNLIMYESKVQVVVSLGSKWVFFSPGSWWVLTQSKNVFELGGRTTRHLPVPRFHSTHHTLPHPPYFTPSCTAELVTYNLSIEQVQNWTVKGMKT